MRKKKGFTLVELIIVLAIIAIMSAILVPAWNNYIRKARFRTADGRAKIVFNAAQTVALKYQAIERTGSTKYVYGTETESGGIKHGDFYYYWNNGSGFACDSSGSKIGGNDALDTRFGESVQRIFGEDGYYKVHIRDYKVMSVYYSQTPNYTYPGSYPVTMSSIYRNSGMGTVRAYSNTGPQNIILDSTTFELS